MMPSSSPVWHHRDAKLGSEEAGRFSGSRPSNRTRSGIATPSPQTMHSRVRSAGLAARQPRGARGGALPGLEVVEPHPERDRDTLAADDALAVAKRRDRVEETARAFGHGGTD